MCLGKIQWGINNAVNSSTQKTATEVLFGLRLRDSLANKMDISADIALDTIQNIREEVSANIHTSQAKQKENYDAGRAIAPTYNKGELVKITRTNFNNKGNSTKLLSKFIGPFKIVEVLGNDRYKIAEIPGFSNRKHKFESVVAFDRIRPWININSSHVNDNNILSSKSSTSSESEDIDDDNKQTEDQQPNNASESDTK